MIVLQEDERVPAAREVSGKTNDFLNADGEGRRGRSPRYAFRLRPHQSSAGSASSDSDLGGYHEVTDLPPSETL